MHHNYPEFPEDMSPEGAGMMLNLIGGPHWRPPPGSLAELSAADAALAISARGMRLVVVGHIVSLDSKRRLAHVFSRLQARFSVEGDSANRGLPFEGPHTELEVLRRFRLQAQRNSDSSGKLQKTQGRGLTLARAIYSVL